MSMKHWVLAGTAAAGLGFAALAATAQTPPTWADVGPIFADNCTRCHGPGGRAGLNLSSYATAIAGSNNGPVLIAGNPDGSLLMRRIRGEIPPQMPRGAPALPTEQIALIAAWIAGGLQE
jgi:mono/diheme cytochrome c family protein